MPGNPVSETLRHGLYTRLVGRRITSFQWLDSTMDEAARQAAAGVEEGAVVLAETQTGSRGRLGRSWVSQPGNLYVSILFYPSLAQLPFIAMLGGVAVARAIRKAGGGQPRLKWPNDVMLGGKKVAGILVETAAVGGRVQHAILGIGVNVALDVEKFPDIAGFATSLNSASGGEVPREDLLRHLLHAVDALYLALGRGQSPLQQWKELLETLGQRVQVSAYGESYAGLAEDIDDAGNLLLGRDDGQLVTLTAGDVSLQPPDRPPAN
jgi:BirA family transcriptional regulator, biotin operon repressor / biotin---[acetyl-CoA-carboxylase] ligase